MIKILILSFLLMAQALAYTPYVSKPQTLNEGGSELLFDFEYFKPTSIVTEDGEGQALTENNNVTHINLNTQYQYGFTPNFQGMLFAGFRYIQMNVEVGTGQAVAAGNYSITNSSFEHAGIGFKYGFDESDQSKYAIEGYYVQKMFSNAELGSVERFETINPGDDTREYGIGMSAYIRTKAMNFFEFKGIYRSPAEYLSTEIFSEAQYTMVWDYAALYGGIENVYSLESSPYSSDETDRPNYTPIGNSKLYNSLNRSWTAPYAGLNFTLGPKWRFGLRYTQIYTGNSTDIGSRIMLTLARRNEEKKEFVKQDSKFKEYRMEGVVTKLSKSRKVAVIDIGANQGLKKGMRVDLYYFDYTGGNQLIAKGVALKVQASKAVIRINKRYGRRRVQEGTVVRAGLIQ